MFLYLTVERPLTLSLLLILRLMQVGGAGETCRGFHPLRMRNPTL